MIAVAPLSQSGVRRNKDSLSIFNFTRKFFINSARRTGSLGQWPLPRWATSLSVQRVQPAMLLLSRSHLTHYTCGQVLFSSLSLVFVDCWLFTAVTICDLLFLFCVFSFWITAHESSVRGRAVAAVSWALVQHFSRAPSVVTLLK